MGNACIDGDVGSGCVFGGGMKDTQSLRQTYSAALTSTTLALSNALGHTRRYDHPRERSSVHIRLTR